MRSIDTKYWNSYYDFWDAQIRDWFERRENHSNSELGSCFARHVQGLDFDELPEPYYGFPDKGVKAVALHHNPGISKEGSKRNTCDERQKCYSCIEDGIGWLIRKFRDKCDCSYQKFVENYSCLIPRYRSRTPEVDGQVKDEFCGVKWWQGLAKDKIDNEVKWLGQIYGKDPNPDDKPDKSRLHPLEVFVLELCPFHSEDFSVNNRFFKDSTMRSFVIDRVFGPAIRAVCENGLPFAVARGAKFKNLFNVMGLSWEMEWSHKGNIAEWPKKGHVKERIFVKKNINRTYRLYKMEDGMGSSARILLTWYSAAYEPPTDKFKDVECQIRKYVAENPLK